MGNAEVSMIRVSLISLQDEIESNNEFSPSPYIALVYLTMGLAAHSKQEISRRCWLGSKAEAGIPCGG